MVGQTIAITTTQLKDSRDYNGNEVRRITALYQLSPGITVIVFKEPLAWTHWGGVDYQAEVVLLSRNIVIQGNGTYDDAYKDQTVACRGPEDGSSTYPCPPRNERGGHVMISGRSAVAKVTAIELYHMGQTNILGRYPMHFHYLFENGYKSYIQDSSVHNSFFRCYTIYGTNGTRVLRNTAFDVVGNCYYLEDGIEEDNKIHYNFAGYVHFLKYRINPYAFWGQYIDWYTSDPVNLLVPSDVSASGFYISNNNNSLIGNAASGGWAGFSFPRFDTPIEPSRSLPQYEGFQPSESNCKSLTGTVPTLLGIGLQVLEVCMSAED
jgi:hypothetical protein